MDAHFMSIPDHEQFENYSLDDLKEVIKARFAAAQSTGLLARLRDVATELGTPHGGPYTKHTLKVPSPDGEVVVFVDSYGGYMTVGVGGRDVCCTHDTRRFIIPGPWVDVVLSLEESSNRLKAHRKAASEQDERRLLMSQVI